MKTTNGRVLYFDVANGRGMIQLDSGKICPITAEMFASVKYDWYKYPSVADQNKLMDMHGKEMECEVSQSAAAFTTIVKKIKF